MIRIVDHKDDSSQRLRLKFRMREKDNRTRRFAQKSPGHISEERMKGRLFFKRARDDKIDIVVRNRAQNSIRRISAAIVNRRICRQSQPAQNALKSLCRLIVAFADINQTQTGSKTVANSLRLRQYLFESRRKCARD